MRRSGAIDQWAVQAICAIWSAAAQNEGFLVRWAATVGTAHGLTLLSGCGKI